MGGWIFGCGVVVVLDWAEGAVVVCVYPPSPVPRVRYLP